MNIPDYAAIISAHIDQGRAYGHVAQISQYHRIQMSQGYRQAADYCLRALQESGVECRLLDIPMPRGTRRLGQRGFDGWDCEAAGLALDGSCGGILCSYEEDPLCIIQRSCPVDARGVEIVMAGSEVMPVSQAVAGKIVFAHAQPWEGIYREARMQGAIGIITDHITEGYARRREDVYDARGFFSFHWLGDEGELPGFGFVLTPRQGDALARLCRDFAQNGRYPLCDARIDARTHPGHVEIVEARIPGREAGEIVVTAHLCHAKPSANDNASGCAGGMELMTALSGLINEGKLQPPRLGITLALVPEASGTFAYLDERKEDIFNLKGMLNLDMIGRRQEGRSGMLGIMGPCDALPSFMIDLMAYVRRLTDCEAPTFNIDGRVSPFHSQILEYFGGSDHVAYGDPTIGVPGVTMMQWMDKDYHTGGDTVENIDPEMLKKSTSMAAIWAYALASLRKEDLQPVLALSRERFLEQLHRVAQRVPIRGADTRDVCEYLLEVFSRSVEDIARFCPDTKDLIEDSKALMGVWMEETCRRLPRRVGEADTAQPDLRIPVRDIASPLSFVGEPLGIGAAEELRLLKRRFEGLYGYHSVDNFILFRMDGKRSSHEIARLVGMESRFYEPIYVSGYIDWLCKHGAAHYREA